MTHPDNELAARVARARYDHTLHDANRPWQSLNEAERTSYVDTARSYLDAAAAAGVALGDASVIAVPVPSAERLTVTVRGTDDQPIERDVYAAHLQAQMDLSSGTRRSLLTNQEAATVAALLDELAGVYPDEDLGRLANKLAVRVNDQLGI